ncbi:MAG: YihY/virulence factor BrkB family protein, partial [Deltaproteobacteria bacterium]|nr:YihY/virulence factor BrkB family protein [Deltaproteobacteria bacterium]
TSNDESKEAAYQPARDINMLTVTYVIEALERSGTDNIPVVQSRELTALSDALKVFGDTIEASPANKLLKDI